MRMTRLAAGIQFALFLSASSLVHAAGAPTFAAHRLLVQPATGVDANQLSQVLTLHGAKSTKVIPQINVHVVELPAQADERAVAALLAHNPKVKFAELDALQPPQLTANDTYYSIAWHLPKIQAPLAWDSSLGANVTVAIVDTGVQAAHPDLAGKVLSGWNVVSNSTDSSDPVGHGTGVAGTVGAASNNAKGVTSVAWNAMLLPVRVSNLADGSAYTSDIANGVVWAADHGARVANVSYGVSGSATVQSAGQYMHGKGGVIAVSAGNGGVYDATTPSDALLSVGATDSNDIIASFSTSGSFVDLSAPGVNIPSTNNAGSYSYWSGTSFSSPVVAGVAALVLAANPALSPAQVDNILITTADDLGAVGYDMYYGAGRVNAAKAVQTALNTTAADGQAPIAAITTPGAGSTVAGLTTVSISASDNVGVSKVDLFINGSLWATDASAPYDIAWDSSLTANGSTTLQAYAWDAAGNRGQSQSISITVSNQAAAPDTLAPTVGFLSPANGAKVSGTVTIKAGASDNLGVTQLTLAIDGNAMAATTSGSLSYSWNTRRVAAGSHLLTATAKDAAGNTTTTSISVTK
ncbi:MAG: S8 family serine peptidase [Gammaproteobacteria bacterium]|nr:S8 family serine peptidase [Gammaproteobacteria bacterium]